MNSSNTVVLYHANCRDGFAAAWVAHRRLGDTATYIPVQYGAPPPEGLDGKHVYLLDFSYKRPTMEDILRRAAMMTVLDHHKTAEEELRGLELMSRTDIVFDMNRSGAMIAFNYFFPMDAAPWPIAYVEDRDLWRFALPYSPEVNAYLGTIPFEFESWNQIANTPWETAIGLGEAIVSKVKQYVAEVRKNAIRTMFYGYNIPIVNAPQCDISELLGALCEGETFAMGWWQRSDGKFQYSLRSRGTFDVSALATRYGGGGHKNAAGFESLHIIHEPVQPDDDYTEGPPGVFTRPADPIKPLTEKTK